MVVRIQTTVQYLDEFGIIGVLKHMTTLRIMYLCTIMYIMYNVYNV